MGWDADHQRSQPVLQMSQKLYTGLKVWDYCPLFYNCGMEAVLGGQVGKTFFNQDNSQRTVKDCHLILLSIVWD